MTTGVRISHPARSTARHGGARVSAAWKLNVEAAVIDGEVVVVAENGDTDFAALESYVASKSPERSAHNLVFYARTLRIAQAAMRTGRRSRAGIARHSSSPFKDNKFDGVYLGRREGKRLVYAGKVENGFSEEQVGRLQDRTRSLKGKRQPIEAARSFPKAEWLEPVLLGDVKYRRKTAGGLLRHPSYKGLREACKQSRVTFAGSQQPRLQLII
jgi:ATP-dependent DNA ligase